jgi:hypothetical protein
MQVVCIVMDFEVDGFQGSGCRLFGEVDGFQVGYWCEVTDFMVVDARLFGEVTEFKVVCKVKDFKVDAGCDGFRGRSRL